VGIRRRYQPPDEIPDLTGLPSPILTFTHAPTSAVLDIWSS
jgi:hypothetical protein